MKQSTKDRILSETPDEVKHRANLLVNKEETLEEVAEIYAVNKSSADVFRKAHREDFINGAKWQQEKSYSQLDVVRILSKYETLSNEDFNKWFEKLKK